MSEPATTTTTTETPSTSADADLTSLLGDLMTPDAPSTPATGQPGQVKATAPAANVPVDPLAEELYAENVLQTPEQAREAAKLLREERAKTAELRKKALNAHSAAEKREHKVKLREQAIKDGEMRQAAWERAVSGSVQDLESGDPERFLTAVARMSKSADPASYWKKVSMKLASGGTFTEAEKKQAQTDPEVQKKLSELEQYIQRDQHQKQIEQEQRDAAYVEHLKAQNLTFAQKSEEHPYVKLYATEQPENIREVLGDIMEGEYEKNRKRGLPAHQCAIDVKAACGILETSLRTHYELSQRVGGNTDGEKGTAGSGPDAGRESSGQPPKPETATRAPATVPASLTATQGNAQRALSPREQRQQQVQSLPPAFWGQFGLAD
jgi:hypothetical protein